MTNELFAMLYDSLNEKLTYDMQDKSAIRSVRIIPKALGGKTAPMILCEDITEGSAMYDGYYPLDAATYCKVLPRCGVIRFNQTNLFNNQMENRLRRQFACGLDRRNGVCCIYGYMTLCEAPDHTREAVERLCYFTDIFASCLGVKPAPVRLDWYNDWRINA